MSDGRLPRRWLPRASGPAVFAILLLVPAPEGMSTDAWRTAAVAAFMVAWWVTEAVPLAATALLPIVLLPLLGVLTIDAASAPYASPIVGLFLGGFLIAQAMQRTGLHRRVALQVIGAVGTRPDAVVGGFMAAAALLSMWISNTATAVMMLPIGLSVVELVRQGNPEAEANDAPGPGFPVALMLGIAYACSIGGLGTLIGSPPNALLAAFMAQRYGIEIGFVTWMGIGLPIVLVALPCTWLFLTRWACQTGRRRIPGAGARLRAELVLLGPLSRGERVVGSVFLLTAVAWVMRPLILPWLPGLSDTGIALGAAVALFALPGARPGERALDWAAARAIPWDVLILFGGGLALAAALSESTLAAWLGDRLSSLRGMPTGVMVVIVTATTILVTELMSNTATIATFLPVLAALADSLGLSPLTLAAPAALAASCAFMMPVATPPNAVVFGSGLVTMRDMLRAGLALNVALAILISLLTPRLVP